MDTLNGVLPIIIYILLIVLIIVAIILGIKLLITLNKVDKVVDNVETKVNSLNDLFDIISVTTNRFELIYSKASDFFVGLFEKIFKKKEKAVEDEEGDESIDE